MGMIICQPVDSAIAELVPPDAEQVTASCGHRVFIGPSSLALMAEHPRHRPICAPCSPGGGSLLAAVAHGVTGLAALPPGTTTEVARELGAAEGDQFLAWLRDVGITERQPDEPAPRLTLAHLQRAAEYLRRAAEKSGE